MKDVQRELAAVRSDIRAIEKGKMPARHTVPGPRPYLAPTAVADDAPAVSADAAQKTDDPVESLVATEKRHPRRPLDEQRLAEEDRAIKARARRMRDDRFKDYLASSFEAGSDLRYERTVQRNKAIVVGVVALGVLVWLLRYLFG